MAYLDPADVFLQGNALPFAMPTDFLSEPVEPNSFEHTEWAVIALARQDGLSSLQEPRRSKVGRLLFGRPRSYTLAAERLEALRRLAVEAWHRPRDISVAALGAFISVGYTSAQLALLLSTTGALPVMAKVVSASLQLISPAARSRIAA